MFYTPPPSPPPTRNFSLHFWTFEPHFVKLFFFNLTSGHGHYELPSGCSFQLPLAHWIHQLSAIFYRTHLEIWKIDNRIDLTFQQLLNNPQVIDSVLFWTGLDNSIWKYFWIALSALILLYFWKALSTLIRLWFLLGVCILQDVDYVCISDNYWLGKTKPCITYGLRYQCLNYYFIS